MTASFVTGCAQNKNEKDRIRPDKSSLTLVLMTDELWFSYLDTNSSHVSFILPNELFQVLNSAKEEKGNDLNIIIRTSDMVQKAMADTVVARIKSRNISKYVIVKMTEKEQEAIIFSAATNMKPPEQIVVTMPQSVVSTELPETGAFLIEIRKGGSVWYRVLSPDPVDSAFHKVDSPITENLKKAIAEFKVRFHDIKKDYLIKGHEVTSYKSFEEVIKALKENDILKYNLVTSLEDQ
ncbi:MAG: biopolymer transporter ExbD [Chitinophagaceae bacterium]|nr:biopolymer transporter ExbD [Chitinophagaceae bacterium]